MSTLPVSSHPPELLEAQPSQIDEVFVKISPAEDKPKVRPSVLFSHWSRSNEARLSLVESFRLFLRQQSGAIKNQFGHSKPPMASMPGNTFYNYKYSVDIE